VSKFTAAAAATHDSQVCVCDVMLVENIVIVRCRRFMAKTRDQSSISKYEKKAGFAASHRMHKSPYQSPHPAWAARDIH
jgi:hypothetical protein